MRESLTAGWRLQDEDWRDARHTGSLLQG